MVQNSDFSRTVSTYWNNKRLNWTIPFQVDTYLFFKQKRYSTNDKILPLVSFLVAKSGSIMIMYFFKVLHGVKIQQPLSGIPSTIAHHMGKLKLVKILTSLCTDEVKMKYTLMHNFRFGSCVYLRYEKCCHGMYPSFFFILILFIRTHNAKQSIIK